MANIPWRSRHWWHQVGRPQRLALLVGVAVTLVALRAVGRTAQSRAWLYWDSGGIAFCQFGVFLAGYLPVGYPCDVAYHAGIYNYQ
jgi:hypothetical protein